MSPILGSIGGMSHEAYRGNLDDYADDFSFENIINAEPGVAYTSGIATITGINNKIKVSIGIGASFSVNGDAFLTSPTFIRDGDELRLSLTTTKVGLATDFSRENNVNVIVGKRTSIWTVTTRPKNDNLVPFSFTSVTNHPVASSVNSNSVNISELEPGYSVPVSIIGFDALISINGGPLVLNGNVSNGDNLYINLSALPVTDQESYGRTRTTLVTVGTYSTTWTVTTESPDLIPDSFTFTNVTNAEINTTYVSNSITVSGITGTTVPRFSIPISISGSGFEYNINGGTYRSQPGSVVFGDVIRLRRTPNTYATTTTGTLTINTVSSNWSITTKSQPFDTVPDPFSFASLTNTPLNTEYTSNEIQLSGMTAGFSATASISGGGEFRVVRSGIVIRNYSSSSTSVQLGDGITLKNVSSSSYITTKTTTLTISGVDITGEPRTTSASWNITTQEPTPLPTITLSGSPLSIAQDSSSTLTWSSTNATSVSSSNFGATTVNGSLIVRPLSTTTYNITVSGPGGSATASRTISVSSLPTITLSASSPSITQGGSTTLTWSSTNATSVSSSNFGATTINGTITVSPISTTTYNITVSGPGGSATASITISVSSLPTVTLSASSSSITQGGSTTLTWNSTNATSVSSSNFGATTVTGSISVSPSSTTTYNITVAGPGGSATASITISVSPPPTPSPTVSLSGSPLSITRGTNSTLTWSSTNATSVSSSNFGASTVNGTTTVSPSSTTTYNITVAGPGGSATASITINVSCVPIEGIYGSFGGAGFTGYLLYGNGFRDTDLQFITNPNGSAISSTIVTTAGGITTTYGNIGQVVINHYVNNFRRFPEQPGGYDYWIRDFISNPSYTSFSIFTNTITTSFNEPNGEAQIRASRGGLVGNFDSCDVRRI